MKEKNPKPQITKKTQTQAPQQGKHLKKSYISSIRNWSELLFHAWQSCFPVLRWVANGWKGEETTFYSLNGQRWWEANPLEQERLWDFSLSPFLLCSFPSFAGCFAAVSAFHHGWEWQAGPAPQCSEQIELSLFEALKRKTTFCTFIRPGCNGKGVNSPHNLKHCKRKPIFCSSEFFIWVSKIMVIWEIHGKQLKL